MKNIIKIRNQENFVHIRYRPNSVNVRHSASFTVEAAVIVPLITMILVLFVYWGFYLHDTVVIKAKLHGVVQHSINYLQYGITSDDLMEFPIMEQSLFYLISDAEEKESVILKYANQTFKKGLFLGKADDIRVNIDGINLVIQAEVTYDLWKNGLFRIFSLESFQNSYQISETILPREEYARILGVSIRTGSKIKGVSDGMKKIADLLGTIR